MYSLDQFGAMIADRVRMDAYTAAIQRAVRPGDVVVDLGCGTGIFALLACSAGASHVYAIDRDGIVEFARHLAVVNGFADRIDFLRGDSRQIHLPGRAKVIVSDIRGALPLFSHAVTTLEDARIRFLAEGGTLLPLRDRLMAAIVEMPVFHSEITNSWKSIPHLDLSAGLPLVLNSLYRHTLKPHQMLSASRSWHVLEYASGAEPQARGTLHLCATHSAIGHGIGVWFETELLEGIGFSTEPRSDDTVYGHIFLPWLEPVSLREADVCVVDLRAHLIGNDYVWQWETTVPGCDGRAPVHFRQSTFYGSTFSQSCLKKRSSDFVPVLSESGLAERWLLQAMNGKRPLENIAAEAVQLFPHVFRRVEDAFNRAAEIAEKYSR
jgi:protein arginine N-methyltransferase 1